MQFEKYKYIRIRIHGGRKYIIHMNELFTRGIIEDELGDACPGNPVTITFEPLNITEEEYNKLFEFQGH